MRSLAFSIDCALPCLMCRQRQSAVLKDRNEALRVCKVQGRPASVTGLRGVVICTDPGERLTHYANGPTSVS